MRPPVPLLIAGSVAALISACAGAASAPTDTAGRDAARPQTSAKACLFAGIFAGLEEVRGIRALCPTWLPAGLEPTSVYASNRREYVVEFAASAKPVPHVVLEFARAGPSPNPIATAIIRGRSATIYFEPPGQPPGLHSGHYIVTFPGSGSQRGSYRVSVHQESRASRQWNIERALRIARSLRSP